MKNYLNEKQIKKFKEWQKSFEPLPYLGATGGHFGLSIIFTSIGEIIHGTNWEDEKIDLTDYENF